MTQSIKCSKDMLTKLRDLHGNGKMQTIHLMG